MVANFAHGRITRNNDVFPVPVRACKIGFAGRVRPSRPASARSFSTLRLNHQSSAYPWDHINRQPLWGHCQESAGTAVPVIYRYLRRGMQKEKNTKPRFEISTAYSSIGARQNFLSAREKSALFAREFSFARCQDAAGAIILHGGAAGEIYTARTRPDGQRLQQELQNRILQQVRIVRSGRCKNGGVLCAARPWRDGRRL